MQKKTFLLEEGLLGACYFEKAPIEHTEIPEDYKQAICDYEGKTLSELSQPLQ